MPRRRKTQLGRIVLITIILIIILITSLYYLHRQSNAPQRLEKINNIARKDVTLKPHFSFYKIVSHNEQQEPTPTQNSLPQPAFSLAPPANYLLQIAAVKNSAYADQLKAQLLLKGYNVSIQKVQNNGEELNRVIIGPFASLSKAQLAQADLKNNNLESILLKL